jgi:CsoR family transcriptional regulator, copper-sensing transcriptional repressor
VVCWRGGGFVSVDYKRVVRYHGGYMEDRKKLTTNLKRIQGQVGGIIKMIEAGKSCEATLTQISAAISSLKGVGKNLLVDEASTCGSSPKSKENYAKLLKRYL